MANTVRSRSSIDESDAIVEDVVGEEGIAASYRRRAKSGSAT